MVSIEIVIRLRIIVSLEHLSMEFTTHMVMVGARARFPRSRRLITSSLRSSLP